MDQDKTARAAQAREDSSSLVERAAERLKQGRAGGNAKPHLTPAPTGSSASLGMADAQAPHIELDLDQLAEQGYLTPGTMRSRLAEETRLIKRVAVQSFWAREVDRPNMIMVTSAWPGEGKSFVALNLAISLACEVDLHVLLVDADFQRPVVFDRLGMAPRRGMMDLLRDPDMDLGDVILRTNIERLSLIGSGSRHDMSTELLASQRMQAICAEMAERYPDRLIVFDTPPMLACSEPAVLAEHVGQVIFVVEADKTQKHAVENALDLLPPNVEVSMTLNKTRSLIGSSNPYYYGYGTYGPRP